MPEQSSPPASPPAAPAAVTLETKFNGKVEKMELSSPEKIAEATRLVQLGRLYEQKEARMNQLQAQMEAKKPMLQAAEKLSEMANSDPEAFRTLMQTYEAVKAGLATPAQLMAAINGRGQVPTASDDPQPVAPTSAGVDAPTRALLTEMRSTLHGLASKVDTIDQATARRDRETLVDAMLGSDEFLASRPEAKAHVRGQILARTERGESLEEATILEGQRIRTLLGEAATAERDRRKAGEDMRTVPPTAGVPPTRDFAPQLPDKAKAQSPERYMKDAWAASRAKARDWARATMRAAVQGPNQ
jgi:hypothetical protein